MKLYFKHYFHQSYEGNEGYMRPTFYPIGNDSLSEMSDGDFIIFTTNLDTVEKTQCAINAIEKYISSDYDNFIIISDGYMRTAKVNIDLTCFNIMPGIDDSYKDCLPTKLFLKMLKAWHEYLNSEFKGEIEVYLT